VTAAFHLEVQPVVAFVAAVIIPLAVRSADVPILAAVSAASLIFRLPGGALTTSITKPRHLTGISTTSENIATIPATLPCIPTGAGVALTFVDAFLFLPLSTIVAQIQLLTAVAACTFQVLISWLTIPLINALVFFIHALVATLVFPMTTQFAVVVFEVLVFPWLALAFFQTWSPLMH